MKYGAKTASWCGLLTNMKSLHSAPSGTVGGIERWAWWAIILGIAVMLTLKYFPGLENETAYSGIAFKAIYPDAFATDLYRGGGSYFDHPLQLTILYGVVSLVGDIWLDDRFLAIVYLGSVIASLIGIDKTARLLGLRGTAERLFLLFMFAKDHTILSNKVLVAHHADVNHTAFAIPLIIWLFYAALARKSFFVILLISIVLASLSLRNAAFPVAMALIVVAVNGYTWERRVIIGMFVAGAMALAAVIVFVFSTEEAHRLELWNLIKMQEEEDANPFQPNSPWPIFILTNIVWIAIIIAAAYLSQADDPAFRGVRIICGLSILTLLFGGAYITFAPDFMKSPILIGFAPTRALAWPQNLAYIALIVLFFQWLRNVRSKQRTILLIFGFLGLFIIGPGNHLQWLALTIATALIVILADWAKTKKLLSRSPATYCASVIILTVITGSSLSISHRADDWVTVAKTGVYGGNPSAEWIGVAEYFRDQTPIDISILPFSGNQQRLYANRSLATRSGRALTVPEVYGPDFRDPEVWKRDFIQLDLLERLGDAILKGQLETADQLLSEVYPKPDYLVVPSVVYDSWMQKLSAFTKITTKGSYMILKRS